MSIVQAALSFFEVRTPWQNDWIWGCPLIVATVLIHVIGLESMNQKALLVHSRMKKYQHPRIASATVIGTITLLATLLHAFEAVIWAAAYRAIGALPDAKSAMLYSLGALTTYGHQSVYLEDHWRLLGTLEALNGWLLFGLTTAFLFLLIQEVSAADRANR